MQSEEVSGLLQERNFDSLITHLLFVLHRFHPIQSRHGIRGTIAEKYVEIFNWYESDLEEVHQIYERHKVCLPHDQGLHG